MSICRPIGVLYRSETKYWVSDVTRRDLGATRRDPRTGMVVSGRPMKRMKRRVTADLYDFLTFPSPSDGVSSHAGSGAGPFRTNVRAFLSMHALLPPPSSLFPHLLTWQILFRVGDLTESGGDSSPAVVYLDIVEEDVARSRSVYCDHCRVVDWIIFAFRWGVEENN